MADDVIPVDAPDETAAEPAPTLHGCPLTISHTQKVLHPTREQLLDVVKALVADGYRQCIDSCGVDYLGYEAARDLPEGIEPGRYEVAMHVGEYFERLGASLPRPAFLSTVPLRIVIHDASRRVHLPVLFSPWGYSFYRGS